jgi:hypothetical protein
VLFVFADFNMSDLLFGSLFEVGPITSLACERGLSDKVAEDRNYWTGYIFFLMNLFTFSLLFTSQIIGEFNAL